MVIRQQLRDVLTIIAEVTQNNIIEDVPDTWVMDRINIPKEETRRHASELVSLGLVRQLRRLNRTADEQGRAFRLIGITREGLHRQCDGQHECQCDCHRGYKRQK
jgi:hypothetical protein